MKRRVLNRTNEDGTPERWVIISDDAGATVVHGPPRYRRITLHTADDRDPDKDACEFLDGRPCGVVSYPTEGLAGLSERLICRAVDHGDWGPLLTLHADAFAPVESEAEVDDGK